MYKSLGVLLIIICTCSLIACNPSQQELDATATQLEMNKIVELTASASLPTLTNTNTLVPPTRTNTPIPPTSTPTATSSATPTSSLAGLIGDLTDEYGIEMALIPKGEFMMGSMYGDSDELMHVVHLDDYFIDLTEVTNYMYSLCVGDGECQLPRMNSSSTRDEYYGNPTYNDYPVIFVNWEQAKTYCEWRHARLPTEAEWEKAALGIERRTYPWGDEIVCAKANFNKCVGDTDIAGNYSAGKSPYGLLDMAGNVAEWVADWYGERYYSASPSENPQGPDTGEYRVVRGGAWDSEVWYLRGSSRRAGNFPPTTKSSLGFRCARSK